MTQKVIKFLCWIFVVTMLLGAHLFATYYLIDIANFELKEGRLASKITVTQDVENSSKNTSLYFYLQGDSKKYSLAGDLLDLAAIKIYDLKEDDNVELWVQKENAKNFFFRGLTQIENIWGISLKGEELLPLTTSIKQRKSISSLVFMTFFLILALATIRYIFRQSNVNKTI